jgi:hypothetical protein
MTCAAGEHMKQGEMGEACGTHGKKRKYMQGVGGEI